MNEIQKNVKRVLVLDAEAVRILATRLYDEDELVSEVFFETLRNLLETGETPRTPDNTYYIAEDAAEIFYRAYGREVEE